MEEHYDVKHLLIAAAATLLAVISVVSSAGGGDDSLVAGGGFDYYGPTRQNEGPTHTLTHQIYDALLQRDMAGEIIPSLATDWDVLPDNPNVWRFNLRKGVKFHNGASLIPKTWCSRSIVPWRMARI